MPSSSVDRVVDHLKSFIGRTSAGEQLPTGRALGRELGVGPVTVQRAMDRLVAQGLVETRPGAGAFVAPRKPPRRADTAWQDVSLGASHIDTAALSSALSADVAGVLQMGAGYLDTSLRASDARLAQAMARAARRPGVWGKPPLLGVPELRTWFAGQTGAEAEDVLIGPAAQGALSAVLRALTAPGDNVLFATPAYPGALAVARTAGLVPLAVPTDGDGIRPELLDRALARSTARVLYVQPTYANPDGSVLAPERRQALLEVAHRRGAVLVEDDWARWLGHRGPVPSPLLVDDVHGHVVTICSLTKVAAPSLRIGAVIARGPLRARIADMRMVDDMFVSMPLQQTAVELVSSSFWNAHLRSISATLRARCEVLAAALTRRLPDCHFSLPRGGASIWLELPDGASDLDVAREAAVRKLFVFPGAHYELTPQPRAHLRLSFAALAETDAEEAVRRLAESIAAATASPAIRGTN